ncbi:MAG: GspE/PulE family protein [Candidatus Gracilibacteria bacterium]|nr:GspE/PulE family protein [Candidatus Gracilibacteria bacterium]
MSNIFGSKKTSVVKNDLDSLFANETPKSKMERGNSNLDISNLGNQKKDDSGIISLINDILLNGLQRKASDIHIEPFEKGIKIRFRIDGQFINYKNIGENFKEAIIARIKIMSYLRIDEHRLPQDGKINFNLFAGKSIDMRVSIIPTIYGEKCVIRILKKEENPPTLNELGLLPYNSTKIKKHLGNTSGMILAVGPTGSGKSTTLFSLLSQFNPELKNISTLEDPVEYRIKGVNHTQVNPSIGFGFAEGLRSLLRQDPDIIMVGEIRDEETAKLAVEASITGHLVLSTLHTNSRVHTIQRLLNLGIDPLLISSSIKLIVSQRLARKLCPKCKESYKPEEKIKEKIVGKIGRYIKNKDDMIIYKSHEGGCERCNNTGYKGRLGIYEILEITEKLEELLLKNASKTQLEIQAVGDGMVPILEDGLLKVVLGDTSLEEILSVLGDT